MLAIGLMSGTSADGIDAALVELDPLAAGGPVGRQINLRAFVTEPYPEEVRRDIFRLFDKEGGDTPLLCRTNYVLGELFARASLAVAAEAGVPIETVDFIASHGQTVW